MMTFRLPEVGKWGKTAFYRYHISPISKTNQKARLSLKGRDKLVVAAAVAAEDREVVRQVAAAVAAEDREVVQQVAVAVAAEDREVVRQHQ